MNPPVDAPASRQRRPVTDTGETGEGGLELVTAARDEAPCLVVDDDGVALGHQARRFVGHGPADEHGAPDHELMGVRP